MLNWRDLVVTNVEGDQTTLGQMVDMQDDGLSHIESLRNGGIDVWYQYFISAPGEEPSDDTPHCDVDWTGFEDALKIALS